MANLIKASKQRVSLLTSRARIAAQRSVLRRLERDPLLRRHDEVAIFLIPWTTRVTGGHLSILELLDESRRIGLALGFDTVACDVPGERSGPRLTITPNSWTLCTLEEIAKTYVGASRVWIHVPELLLGRLPHLPGSLVDFQANIGAQSRVIVNVLNQNVDLVPDVSIFRRLKRLGLEVTMTTAHRAYATAENASYFDVPVHHISTWVSKERYDFARLAPKDDRLLISPDNSELNKRLIIALNGSETSCTTISGISYDEYLSLTFRSRWSATFGEGLDAYFVEMALSGGIPFAVYNTRFFTTDFIDLPNVFGSEEELITGAPRLIRRAKEEQTFAAEINRLTVERLQLLYDISDHRARLTKFYLGGYEFLP